MEYKKIPVFVTVQVFSEDPGSCLEFKKIPVCFYVPTSNTVATSITTLL